MFVGLCSILYIDYMGQADPSDQDAIYEEFTDDHDLHDNQTVPF